MPTGVKRSRQAINGKGVNIMRMIRKLIRKMLVLPVIGAIPAESGVDMEELGRIVRERTARAEKSVLKDYFAQLGLNEEQAKEAEKAYKAAKSSEAPTKEQLAAAEERAKSAEKTARQAQLGAEARVQMALLGVREECFSDVLRLAFDNAPANGEERELTADEVRQAVEAVIERVPSFAAGAFNTSAGISAGTPGRFPRGSSAVESYRQQLNRAREVHDNALAAAIISQAAEKGIVLR